MRIRPLIIVSLFIVIWKYNLCWSQSQYSSSSALQSSNILNPNLSVIGWFQGETKGLETEATPVFQFKEAEIAFQSVVDPYARADFFVAVEGEGEIELEEGYLSLFNLPANLFLKLGKFRANFGKFNRTHKPETAFADIPLMVEKYFGNEGLTGSGVSLSYHLPNPWLLVNLDGEMFTMPETPALVPAERKDLLYLARLSGYHDFTEALNLTLGSSYANGSAGQEFDQILESSQTLRSQLYSLDFTLRWKNPRRAIYRSWFWQTEFLSNKREISTISSIFSRGLFSHLEYQFARRWRLGGRYDWSESPLNDSEHEQGGLIYLTFTPSEFSLFSLQGKRVNKVGGETEDIGFFKVTFNLGPHGAHPF